MRSFFLVVILFQCALAQASLLDICSNYLRDESVKVARARAPLAQSTRLKVEQLEARNNPTPFQAHFTVHDGFTSGPLENAAVEVQDVYSGIVYDGASGLTNSAGKLDLNFDNPSNYDSYTTDNWQWVYNPDTGDFDWTDVQDTVPAFYTDQYNVTVSAPGFQTINQTVYTNFGDYPFSLTGDFRMVSAQPEVSGNLIGVSHPIAVANGGGAGTLAGEPQIKVLGDNGQVYQSILAFPGFAGDVHVAMGDIDGDGVVDTVIAAGKGGRPHVMVISGADGSILRSFFAYAPNFTGGVEVAVGDVNGDGRADIITGAGPGGGPHVQVFSGVDNSVLLSFMAYDVRFAGGVNVAAGDVDGDGKVDVVTGAGAGGGPHVKVFSGADGSELRSFFAYDARFTGGVYVAAGDLNGDGKAEIITGAGAGGGPHVKVFDGATNDVSLSFFAYAPAFTGGVRVGTRGLAGAQDIVTGAGRGGGPHVKIFGGQTGSVLSSFFAPEEPGYLDGIFVGGN